MIAPALPTSRRNLLSVAAALLALVTLGVFLPAQGLAANGPWILAIFAMTVILWAFSSMENAAVTLLMMGALTLAGLPLSQVMGGFASGAFWILLAVLYYGYGMRETGLARRISFSILALFPPSYASILLSFFIVGTVLSLAIPSSTVRTAIMIPIAWALVRAIGIPARSRGSALIMLSTVEMAVLPGIGFLYGSLWGPFITRLFDSAALPLTWLGYAQVLTLPSLLRCLGVLAANLWLMRPREALSLDRDYMRRQLRELGPLQRSEWIMAGIIAASIFFWMLDSIHHLPAYVPGLFAVPLMSLTRILDYKSISTGIPWPLMIFIGGILSMIGILEANHINTWLAGYLVPAIEPLMENTLLLILTLALGMMLLKFIDPSGFLALTALFVPLVTPLTEAGVAPLVFIAILLLPAHPFFATYQNIWVAMTEGITGGEAFSDRQRMAFAVIYLTVTLAALMVSALYWKALGLLV